MTNQGITGFGIHYAFKCLCSQAVAQGYDNNTSYLIIVAHWVLISVL